MKTMHAIDIMETKKEDWEINQIEILRVNLKLTI